MESSFKHRLVGTVILVAIGIIFLPDLLDGKKIAYREDTASIPLRPALTELAEPVNFDSLDNEIADAELLAEPAPTVNLTDIKQVKTVDKVAPTTKVITKTPKLAPIVKPVATKKALPAVGDSWHIRLGTFKNSEGVDELVTKIRKQGYDAYRLPRYKQAGKLNRLYVGPNVNKNELVLLLPKLEKITGLKGVVQKFDPRDK